MKRTPIHFDPTVYPAELHPLLEQAKLFDSSCSSQARVTYIQNVQGEAFFLKSAPKGSLRREALLTEYMHRVFLAPQVLSYLSLDRDWLLTSGIEGEDCTHADHLASPKKLCDLWAEILRTVHALPVDACPVQDHTASYCSVAEENYRAGCCDLSYGDGLFDTAEEAWAFLQENKHLLKNDTLLHGDYCLPNVMLKDWKLSGLIDLGNGGVGDRHVDLFWGAWTLRYNLGTDAYRDRFFDAYGRDRIDPERLRVVAAAEVFG